MHSVYKSYFSCFKSIDSFKLNSTSDNHINTIMQCSDCSAVYNHAKMFVNIFSKIFFNFPVKPIPLAFHADLQSKYSVECILLSFKPNKVRYSKCWHLLKPNKCYIL